MCANVYLTSWNVAQGQQRDVEKITNIISNATAHDVQRTEKMKK